MGIFDMGFDAPDSNGWETRVTPGAADANNLSLAERIRATLTGSTNPNPQAAGIAKEAGKVFSAAVPKPSTSPQAAAADPKVPPRPGIDPQLLASLGRSPFAAAGGAPKPPMPKIYQMGHPQSPFVAA